MDAELMSKLGFNDEQKKAFEHFESFVNFRNRFSLVLSVVLLIVYYSFMAVVGLFPHVLGYTIGPTVVTVGIVVGVAIIVIAIIMTGIYTFVANKYFDREQAEIVSKLQSTGVSEKITQHGGES